MGNVESTFVTKDSGARQEFASGMVRDLADGKPDYALCDSAMLKRWAELMTRGAVKYGKGNWRKANSQEEYDRFRSSAFRHFMQWMDGEPEEDHGAAVFFNIAAAEYVKVRLRNDYTDLKSEPFIFRGIMPKAFGTIKYRAQYLG